MKRLSILILCILILIPGLVAAQGTIDRPYNWYAEEKLTVSTTAKQLSSEEYGYTYGPTRIDVEDPNTILFVAGEVVTDATTGAMGILDSTDQDPNDYSSISYIDIQILYNGGDSADIDANDWLVGASGAAAQAVDALSYTRGTAGRTVKAYSASPLIAEVHVLSGNLIWTANGATPVYDATASSCFGEKQYIGDTFYLYGTGVSDDNQIINFKAVRVGSSDATIYVRYGK